jgi:hypothetical protein
MGAPDFLSDNTEFDVLIAFRFSSKQVSLFTIGNDVTQLTPAFWLGTTSLVGTYAGLVDGLAQFNYSLGTKIRPEISYSSFGFKVRRDDSKTYEDFLSYLASYNYGGSSQVIVGILYTAKGTAPNPFTDMRYVGILKPRGVTLSSEGVDIQLSDRLERFDTQIYSGNTSFANPLTFEKEQSLYEHVDPAWEDKPIPILFGQWLGVEDEYQIEAVVIDTTAPAGILKLKLSFVPDTYSMEDIGDFVRKENRDGVSAPLAVINKSGSDGTFEVDNSPDVWEEGDKWYIETCAGIYDGSILTTFRHHPATLIHVLLTTVSGASVANIDENSFGNVQGDTPTFVARNWMTQDRLVSDVIADICFEFGYIMFVQNDDYSLRQVGYNYTGITPDVDVAVYGANISKGTFSVAIDKGDWFSDGIRYQYKFMPKRETFFQSRKIGNPSFRKMELVWLYDSDNAAERLLVVKNLFTEQVKWLQLSLIRVGMDQYLGGNVRITHDFLAEEYFQIFEIVESPNNGETTIKAISIDFNYPWGFWTDDEALDYIHASEDVRKGNGYWTDGSGEAEPGNPDSDQSSWVTDFIIP